MSEIKDRDSTLSMYINKKLAANTFIPLDHMEINWMTVELKIKALITSIRAETISTAIMCISNYRSHAVYIFGHEPKTLLPIFSFF